MAVAAYLRSDLHDVRGTVIWPSDLAYERARAVWNGAADRRPAVIVRCADAGDVSVALAFARAHGLPVAVRSGGHSMAGQSTVEGGVLIDLSAMTAIAVDPARRVARIEPGLTWGGVAAALAPHGLALTSGDTATVGVGGLTLGGGIGWMARKYGLIIDHLRAVELVTADGAIRTASAAEHPDLFWGLRGGGGNFGIATAFEFDLHPGGMILGGVVIYDAADAEEILAAYTEYAAGAPDELTTMALIMPAPPAPFIPPAWHGKPIVAIAVCYAGDLVGGDLAVARLRRLGTPIADVIAPMPYPAIFALTAEAEVRGLHHAVRSHFLKRLDRAALRALVMETAATMAPGTIVQLRVLGGAVSRVANDATAFAHRDKPYLVMIANFGPDPADAANREARTERIWRAILPYATGVYANFLADEGELRVRDAYPRATYARLAALKARYDPSNLFRLNQNIAPAL